MSYNFNSSNWIKSVNKISVKTFFSLLCLCELLIIRFIRGQHMTKTYTQCVSGDNLSLENIFGIIIIQLQLKKCGETLNVASNARRHIHPGGMQMRTGMRTGMPHANPRSERFLNGYSSFSLSDLLPLF